MFAYYHYIGPVEIDSKPKINETEIPKDDTFNMWWLTIPLVSMIFLWRRNSRTGETTVAVYGDSRPQVRRWLLFNSEEPADTIGHKNLPGLQEELRTIDNGDEIIYYSGEGSPEN